MLSRSSRISRLLTSPSVLIRRTGALREVGWLQSRLLQRPCTREGAPIPWLVYGAIDMLDGLIQPTWSVFEYGSGSSTHWLAERASKIVTIEHDQAWAASMSAQTPANVRLEVVDLSDGCMYAESFARLGGKEEVVIIDGRDRVACAEVVVAAARNPQIIVFDNSDRDRYTAGLRAIRSLGLREVVFGGLVPGMGQVQQTTVFFR